MRRCTVVILFVVFCSCSFVAELLNMEAAQIISWSPKRECVAVEEVPYITVCFSNTMNRPLCEEAFSLTKDADKVRGNFAWREQDSVLVFSPAVPVSKGCCYALTVAATAEDIYGNEVEESVTIKVFDIELEVIKDKKNKNTYKEAIEAIVTEWLSNNTD